MTGQSGRDTVTRGLRVASPGVVSRWCASHTALLSANSHEEPGREPRLSLPPPRAGTSYGADPEPTQSRPVLVRGWPASAERSCASSFASWMEGLSPTLRCGSGAASALASASRSQIGVKNPPQLARREAGGQGERPSEAVGDVRGPWGSLGNLLSLLG